MQSDLHPGLDVHAWGSTGVSPGSSRRKSSPGSPQTANRNLIFLSHDRGGVLFQLLCHLLYHLGHLIHFLGSQFHICEHVILPSAEKESFKPLGDLVQASCQL